MRAGKELVGHADLNLLSPSYRVAIVGASRSGKTVFLTSLLDHLRNHDPRRFRIQAAGLSGKGTARITNHEVLEVRPGIEAFPYELFRTSLIQEAQWPKKTRDTYQYRIKIHRDDSLLSRVGKSSHTSYLSFLDFPGERIADAPMTGATYEDWSDAMCKVLPAGGAFDPLVSAFQLTVDDPKASDAAILLAYKAVLVERLRQFHTAISPSTFLLCPEGTTPDMHLPAQALMEQRCLGLSAERQFCPLPAAVRARRPDLAGRFGAAFEAYKSQLILPLYAALKDTDKLCLLVNIPEILQSGVAAYNDQVELLSQVVAYCHPRKSLPQALFDTLYKTVGKVLIDDRYRPGGIDTIAFVATQADRVRAGDMGRLKSLLGELQKHSTRSLPHVGLKMGAFTCVAVQATKPAGEGLLQARLMSAKADRQAVPELEEYSVQQLPETWPANWDPFDYAFPDVLPKFNQNRNIPPEQVGLDRLFNFLIQ